MALAFGAPEYYERARRNIFQLYYGQKVSPYYDFLVIKYSHVLRIYLCNTHPYYGEYFITGPHEFCLDPSEYSGDPSTSRALRTAGT